MLVEVFHDLLHAGMIVDAQIAYVLAYGSEIEKCYGNFSPRQLMNQAQAYFGRHHGHAAHFVLHHPLGGFARSARIVVGVAENRVIPKFARARLETLDYLGEEWILNVGNNDAQGTALAGSQVPRVNVRKITKPLNRGEH